MRQPSLNDFFIISYLSKNEGAYGIDVAEGCTINTESIYTMLRRLCNKRLLSAEWNERNENQKLYRLTEQGAQRLLEWQDTVKRFL